MKYLSYLKDNKRIEEVDSKELDSIVLDYIENNYEELEQYTNDEKILILGFARSGYEVAKKLIA